MDGWKVWSGWKIVIDLEDGVSLFQDGGYNRVDFAFAVGADEGGSGGYGT